MANQNDLRMIQQIINNLDRNRAAVFSYTQAAFDNDDADGVETFDRDKDQNIPAADKTEYNTTVLLKGVRSQGASIPRNGWNHYIGRFSYNLNKLIQKMVSFVTYIMAVIAHNAAEYDPTAYYRTNDIVYYVETVNNVKVFTWFIRTSVSPDTITGIPPTTALHWAPMQNKTSSSALLPFSAPGYRHKFAIADLTQTPYLANRWYPVITGLYDFDAKVGGTKEGIPQVLIEAYCNGNIAGFSNPHRAELSVISKFTGFPESSTDIVVNNSLIDMIDGTIRSTADSPIGFSKLIKGKQAIIWLRGGAKYALWNSFGSDFTVHASQYQNGADGDIIDPSMTRQFVIRPGTIRAKVKTPDALEAEEAVNLGQVSGSLPLPNSIGSGAQIHAIRTPGSYIVSDPNIANSIQQLPVANPGPFELVVRGDKAGLSTTTQQITFKTTGNEYTCILSGNTVVVPWYLSGSPNGIASLSGLYVFRVINGHLILSFRDGDTIPDFKIDENGHLIADII
jgi:hypothetical protein